MADQYFVADANVDYSKRFWVFAYMEYHSTGGLRDVHSIYDVFDEAITGARKEDHNPIMGVNGYDNLFVWDVIGAPHAVLLRHDNQI